MAHGHGRYDHLFGKSWRLLAQHPVLFFPNLVSVILTFIITALFFYASGLAHLLVQQPLLLKEGLTGILTQFSQLSNLLFWFSMYIIAQMVNLVYFTGMKYGMAKDLVEEGACTIRKGFVYAAQSFSKLLRIGVLGIILLFVPLAVIFYFASLFYTNPQILVLLMLVFFLVVLGLYFFLVSLHLMFFVPTMYYHDKAFSGLVKHDITYVKTHFLHTVLVWLIVVSVFLFFFFLRTPMALVQDYYTSLWILLIASLLMLVLDQVFQVWKNIFVFLAYKEHE